MDGAIAAPTGEQRPVWTPSDRLDISLMSTKNGSVITSVRVPQADCAVFTPTGEQRPVWTPDNRLDITPMSTKRSDGSTPPCVPR